MTSSRLHMGYRFRRSATRRFGLSPVTAPRLPVTVIHFDSVGTIGDARVDGFSTVQASARRRRDLDHFILQGGCVLASAGSKWPADGICRDLSTAVGNDPKGGQDGT